MKSTKWTVAGAFATLLIGGMATPAMAADNPGSATPQAACGPGDYNYKDVGDVYTFTKASGFNSTVSGDPGITLNISRTTTFTVGGSLGITSSISGSIIVLTAQSQLGITLTASISGTSSSSGSWTVPNNYPRGGRLTIGARKHRGTIEKFRAKPADCTNGSLIASTSYNAPEEGWHFQHVKL